MSTAKPYDGASIALVMGWNSRFLITRAVKLP